MIKSLAVFMLVMVATSTVRADDTVHDADPTSVELERIITNEAKSARRVRLGVGGATLALGGLTLGVGVGVKVALASRNDDPSVTRHDDSVSTYVLFGGSVLAMATGAWMLATETPWERVHDNTRNATGRQKRQAIAIEARNIDHRRKVFRVVGLGFLAASAATFAVYGATDLSHESDAGQATLLAGTAAGAAGLTLTLTSFMRSPIEKKNEELPGEMMRASRVAPARVTAGVVPARGGALVGIGGAF